MNPIFYLLVATLIVAQFRLPRCYAALPLLIAACHFQNVPVVSLGANFDTAKLIILAGLIRAGRERLLRFSWQRPLDRFVVLWAGWMLVSGFAHNPPDHNPITIRLSQMYGVVGTYLYARAFLRSPEDYHTYLKCLVAVIAPLALLTLFEKFAQSNLYGLLGSGSNVVTIRSGRVRAAGPFSHPILLGTFAATASVLFWPLYRPARQWALVGLVSCVVIVFSSASSGPIVTMASAMMGMALWHWRTSVGKIRTAVILTFLLLHLAMQAPVWYLMARIDLAGGSTGWHRAELITAAVNHFGEWWLTGTDYTRHWIPYGIDWSAYHTDITNHYISMGVTGGLLLMLLFIGIMFKAFQMLGRRMAQLRREKNPLEFTLWSVGAALFAHCFTFLSISYFDQSSVTHMLLVGAVPGLCLVAARKMPPAAASEPRSV